MKALALGWNGYSWDILVTWVCHGGCRVLMVAASFKPGILLKKLHLLKAGTLAPPPH